nr:glycosyltransferase [Methanocalculus sp. AMF5]
MQYHTRIQPTIAFVLPYLKSRGTEKQALGLAKGFVEKGARVILFVVQGWGQEAMYRAFAQAGVEVIHVGSPDCEGEKRVRFLRVFRLATLAKEYNCDILLSRAGMTNQICGYAGMMARIPALVVLSGSVNWDRLNIRVPFSRFITFVVASLMFGRPHHVITVSRQAEENFILNNPMAAHSVTAIPNGVDIETLRTLSAASSNYVLPQDRFNLCYSGSLEIDRKGLDILLEAIYHLVYEENQRDLLLTLIGTGDDMLKVQDLVDTYALSNYVHFSGETDNPHSIIQQADLFILPSRREGMPNALLEAMALGICSIASDCDTGPREIITHGTNGLLVPVENSRALASAIYEVKDDNALRRHLADNGRQTVESGFSYQIMIDRYYDLIESIVFNNTRRERI